MGATMIEDQNRNLSAIEIYLISRFEREPRSSTFKWNKLGDELLLFTFVGRDPKMFSTLCSNR